MKVRIPDHVDMSGIVDLTKGKEYKVDDNDNIEDDVGYAINIIFECENYKSLTCPHLSGQALWEVVKED